MGFIENMTSFYMSDNISGQIFHKLLVDLYNRLYSKYDLKISLWTYIEKRGHILYIDLFNVGQIIIN